MVVFVGYPYGIKGYEVYNLQSQSLCISRDVTFQEHVFPFHHLKDDNALIDFFSNSVLPRFFFEVDNADPNLTTPTTTSPTSELVSSAPRHNSRVC